jgi:hypothetical protein
VKSELDSNALNEASPKACEDAPLEEYRQLCEYHRHDDKIKWTILGLGYTASGALVSFAIDDDNSPGVRGLLLFLASLAVVCVSLIYIDVDKDTRKRLIRLHECEKVMDIRNHRCFPHPNDNTQKQCFPVNLIVRAAAVVYVACISFLIVMMCDLPILR